VRAKKRKKVPWNLRRVSVCDRLYRTEVGCQGRLGGKGKVSEEESIVCKEEDLRRILLGGVATGGR